MASDDNPILEVKGLKVGIEGTSILKGIDLIIPKGEIHAIMGRNGSGKTTTANVIMGHPAYEIEDGEMFLDGESLQDMEPWECIMPIAWYDPTIPSLSEGICLYFYHKRYTADELYAKLAEHIQSHESLEVYKSNFPSDQALFFKRC